MDTKELLQKVINCQDLTKEEANFLMRQVGAGKMDPIQIGGFLTALATKGESVDEIVGFVTAMRELVVPVKSNGVEIDTCGTGGDTKSTFNVSTAVALVVAAVGGRVAKHGNRAVSSSSGSADVLEELGVNITLTPDQAAEVLREVGVVFLFAPSYHPAMKYVVPVRRALGVRTVFNYLGPLLNPAGVTRQLIGVPTPEIAKKIADVCAKLDYKHAIIVSSEDGLDEISIGAKTQAYEVKGSKIRDFVIDPQEFGLESISSLLLQVDDAGSSARIITDVLDGKKGEHRDIVALNAAYALLIAGIVSEPKEGYTIAQTVLDNGSAREVLNKLVTKTKVHV